VCSGSLLLGPGDHWGEARLNLRHSPKASFKRPIGATIVPCGAHRSRIEPGRIETKSRCRESDASQGADRQLIGRNGGL